MNTAVSLGEKLFSRSARSVRKRIPDGSNNTAALLCLLLTLLLESYSFAAERPEIDVPYTTASFTVDGSAADWAEIKARGRGISFYKGDGHGGTVSSYGTTVLGTISGPADCSVNLWLAHDAAYLYVLAEVQDDAYEPFAGKANANMAYLEDTLHLYIDSTNAKKSAIANPPIYYQPGFEQFGYSTDGNIYGEHTDFNTTGSAKQTAPQNSSPDGVHWAAKCTVKSVTTGGYLYTFEERIALSAYRNMAAMTPGNSYGFEAEFCDADNGTQLQGWIFWSSNGSTIDAWNYENLWGTMKLEAVPAPPSLKVASWRWLDGTNVVTLAWTNNGSSCVLESTASLPGGWNMVSVPFTTNADCVSTVVTNAASTQFFHLKGN